MAYVLAAVAACKNKPTACAHQSAFGLWSLALVRLSVRAFPALHSAEC